MIRPLRVRIETTSRPFQVSIRWSYCTAPSDSILVEAAEPAVQWLLRRR
jgi:hypothetical protein